MKKILSKTITAIILLIVTVLALVYYVCVVANPVTYGMKYFHESAYEGKEFKGSLKYFPDGKVINENTNFDEPRELYYYYKDGYVFNLMAKTEEQYEAEVKFINENFEDAVNMPFYATKTNAFKQVFTGPDGYNTIYTCTGAIVFAIIGAINRLLLIALTACSFVLSKKAKSEE
jgi:hypothetical protein